MNNNNKVIIKQWKIMLTLFRCYFNYFTKNNRYNSKVIVTRFADGVMRHSGYINLNETGRQLENNVEICWNMKGLNQNIVTVEIDRNNIEIMVEIKIIRWNKLKFIVRNWNMLKFLDWNKFRLKIIWNIKIHKSWNIMKYVDNLK